MRLIDKGLKLNPTAADILEADLDEIDAELEYNLAKIAAS
jgi:hypothetical protein